MKKNNLIISILIFFGIIFSVSVFAKNTTAEVPAGSENTTAQAVLMAKQKDKAVQEIDRRIAFLNEAIEKIQITKKINTDQKNALVLQVQNEITFLQQLKEKIKADTDKTTLLEDRKLAVQRYKIFGLLQSEIAIIAYADKILNIADLMDPQTINTEAKNKIADAKSKAQKAIADILVLTFDGFPQNKSVLRASKDLLTSARQELNDARVIIKQETVQP